MNFYLGVGYFNGDWEDWDDVEPALIARYGEDTSWSWVDSMNRYSRKLLTCSNEIKQRGDRETVFGVEYKGYVIRKEDLIVLKVKRVL